MALRRDAPEPGPHARADRTLLYTGVMLAIGKVGTLDGVIFHQLLRWHVR